jgi:gustatory receptor
MKHLYYVAKILGLAPFTLKVNPATKEEIIDIKFTSNIGGFIASAIIFVVLLTGFVFATFLPEFSLSKDPVQAVTYAVSVPLNFVGSLVLVTMVSTVNRYKLEKLVNKLASIDKNLFLLRSGYFCKRDEKSVQLYMPILVLAVLVLSYDAFISVDRLNPVFCIVERLCNLISLVAVMQYCKIALMIRGRLSAMKEVLSLTFCKRLSNTNSLIFKPGAFTVTSKVYIQTCNILQASRADTFDDPVSLNGIKSDLKTVHIAEVEVILKLRRIYHYIYKCVKIINFMYGLPILIQIFRTATGLPSVLYTCGTFFNEHTEKYVTISCIIWSIVLLVTVISVTVICDMAASKPKDIAHKLQAILLKDSVSSEAVEQLKLFCQQMSSDRIAFTAAGLFDVDLSLLCTVLTSITTYIVVLIQFKLH